MKMAFTRKTEVRNISTPEFIKIAEILSQPSTNPAWKKLMQSVPFELTNAEQLIEDSRPKYNYKHIKSLEEAGSRGRPAAQIFLEEWTDSGRIRPTLSHLLQLLVKSELFRAADYVAINLLSEAPPQRPNRGPAAKVDITLPQDDSGTMNMNKYQVSSKDIPNKPIFDHMSNTPMSEEDFIRLTKRSENGANEVQVSNDGGPHIPLPHTSPTIANSLTSQQQNNTTHASTPQTTSSYLSADDSVHSQNFLPNFSLLNIHSKDLSHTNAGTPNVSHPQTSGNIPQVTSPQLLNEGSLLSCSNENVPRVSELLNGAQSTSPIDQGENSWNIPQVSELLNGPQSSSLKDIEKNSWNVPRVSELLNGAQSTSSMEQQEFSDNVPHFSELLNQSHSPSDTVVSQCNVEQ